MSLRRTVVVVAAAIVACSRPVPPPPAVEPAPAPVDSVPVPPPPAPDSVPAVPDSVALAPVEVPEEVEAPPPPPTPPPPPEPVRVCAGGDVLLGNNLDTTWALRASSRLGRSVSSTPNPDSLLAPLRPLVADADVVLLNIEGAIGEGPAPSKCRPGSTRCYAFRQPTAAAPAFRNLHPEGAVVGNVANNHAMDAGAPGFEATGGHLTAAGVHVTGVDSVPTVVVTATGDTVVFLGFATAQAGPDPRNLAAVRRFVARAAEIHPRVVVSTHMGAEGSGAQRTPNADETYAGENRGNAVAFARAAIDAGAVVVFGHGPHVMRAVEWYGDGLIFYSLGNLLTYGPFNLSEPLNRGAVACVQLDADGDVVGAELRPTWQMPPGIVAPDPSGRAVLLADSLSRLDFPASAATFADEGQLLPPARPDAELP